MCAFELVARFERAVMLDRLGGAEQFDRDDVLGEFDDASRFRGGTRTERVVVFNPRTC